MPSIDNPLPQLREKPESPVSAVLERIELSLNGGKINEAMEHCLQALTLSNNLASVRDFALAQAYRAYIHGLLKQQSEGDKAAEQAMERFRLSGNKHNEAMTHLIHALIHYKVGDMRMARAAYSTSCEHLVKLYHKALAVGNMKQANKYDEMVQQVKKRLERIAQVVAERHTVTNWIFQAPWISSGDSLHFLPVIGPIPAGQATISTDDITQYVIVAGNQVIIDDARYCFKRFHSSEGSIVRLNLQQYNYYLSCVIGDSMDQSGIDDGDYVLLSQQRDLPPTARSHDIVAASITDVDKEAILKRYIKRDNTIILQPESSNPEHKPHKFREGDGEVVTIVGTAIAVLKPTE